MDQAPFVEFATFLSALRDGRGLSQSDVARSVEVAPSQVSAWASGRTRPRPENLERMAEVYALDLDTLLAMCKYRRRSGTADADPDETELLAHYRQLASEHRPTIMEIVRRLSARTHSNVGARRPRPDHKGTSNRDDPASDTPLQSGYGHFGPTLAFAAMAT